MSGPGPGELGRAAVAQGAMGSDGVVLDAPVLDQHARFEQGAEGLHGEQLVAEPPAEALHIRVLPGRAWFVEPPAQPAAEPVEPQAVASPGAARGETRGETTEQPHQASRDGLVAGDAAPGARLADPMGRARA